MVRAELPAQVVAGDEAAQPGVEGADVVVLEVDLDEGLPVVVALVHLDAVEHMAAEVQRGGDAAVAQRRTHVAPAVVEQQPLPAMHRPAVQVQARLGLEMRRADQLAVQAVGPAVDRADDVLARLAAAAQHQRLAVATDVGDQAHALRVAHQRAAFRFVRQRVVVARLADPELVSRITRAGLEDQRAFVGEHVLVEVTAY